MKKKALIFAMVAGVVTGAAVPASAAPATRPHRDLLFRSPEAVVDSLCVKAKRERGLVCTSEQRSGAVTELKKIYAKPRPLTPRRGPQAR